MSVTVRVIKDTNLEGVAELARRIRAGRGMQRALVGVPAGKEEADGASMAMVGATVEFGKEDQPERPFLRMGIREGLPLVRQVAAHDLAAVADGHMSMETVLERMGAAGVGAIKEYMTGDHFAPNAPSTIEKKGSEQPTIDTGALRAALTNVVEAVK